MAKFIGRKVNVGIGKETTRGTAVAPEFWLPKMELEIDDVIEQVINESSVGVIEDAENADIVLKKAEGSLTGRIDDTAFGLWLLATLGKVSAPSVVSGETSVYDHTFSVLQDAQHPSLTISVNDENGDRQYPLGMVNSLELNIALGEFATYNVEFQANKSESATLTPSYSLTERVFLPQHGEVKFASDLSGLDSAPAINVKSVSLTISKNIEDDQVLGSVDPVDRLNKQFEVEGTIELLYTDRSYIDTILLGDLAQALRIRLTGTETIGNSSNPRLTIDLAKVKLNEVSRDLSNNEIVKQTLNFKSFYSLADAKSITAVLRNLRSTSY